MRVLLFVFVALLVNFPYAQERWTDHRVSSQGIEVEATVISERELNDQLLIDYLLPEAIDPRQTHYSASVDRETFVNAQDTDRIAVRVVPGDPDANRALGRVASTFLKVVAIVADVVLIGIAIALWIRRRST